MDSSGIQPSLFKILVVGAPDAGKTSLIRRYVHTIFSPNYRVTVGVDFAVKQLELDDVSINVQLWDIAGMERFSSLTRVYYKEALGAVVVFDLTSPESLEMAARWKSDIDSKVFLKDGSNIPCLLLANKCDLESNVTSAQLDAFTREHSFLGWAATSARTGKNVDDAFGALVRQVHEIESAPYQDEMPDNVVQLQTGPASVQLPLRSS